MRVPRCEATTRKDAVMALIAGLNGEPVMSRCDLPAGHDGAHQHRFSPFPGFVDHVDTWYTEPQTVEVPDEEAT